ncbi:MAG: hypothetical protein ACD_36C00041G0003 [uncultured bacterium]|uniref:Uncharacterized protein n=1 Tax=Candidatus Gottesmanbacteria bacterium RIFCSPLOWO2_01_FULL_43_11b TaxID=1798392 RepID=A0A1F6AHG1_9BACT|nr:MAG: hypothetical protein ACD_36C00041G0003 [uncultured bacterium]OGG24154.1 MAG: hypothetical protein A3A79_03105 [Candidatus Gottesmanbacteria bacterium RIFCSPLOWO2_01_FULL_43_11b]
MQRLLIAIVLFLLTTRVLASETIPLQFFSYTQMKLPVSGVLESWQEASGSGTYTIGDSGEVQLSFTFSSLVPESSYQLMCFRTQLPPTNLTDEQICSDGDWSKYSFRSDGSGAGTIGLRLPALLPETTAEQTTVLALSYSPNGASSSVHLLSIIPMQEEAAKSEAAQPQKMRWGIIIGGLLFVGLGAWWVWKRTLPKTSDI